MRRSTASDDTLIAVLLPPAVLWLVVAYSERSPVTGLAAWAALLVAVHVAGPLPPRR